LSEAENQDEPAVEVVDTEPAATDASLPPTDERVEALRREGAERLIPVTFRLAEALARRTASLQGTARQLLEAKLNAALADCRSQLQTKQQQAEAALKEAQSRHPQAAEALQTRLNADDLAGLRRLAGELERQQQLAPLADLCRQLAAHLSSDDASPPAATPDAVEGQDGTATPVTTMPSAPSPAPTTELKAVRYFKETWTQLSLEQQLTQALAQMPENAGPLNSHMLVLRALILMRDQAPAYLHRFMAYLETLLWFEAPESATPPAKKGAAPAKAAGSKAGAKTATAKRKPPKATDS
jgi:hypothetical protein